MQSQKPSLIGSIVERKPKSTLSSTSKPSTSGKTGFPTVQHRSKSAFSRSREEQRKFGESRAREVPTVLRAPPTPAPEPAPSIAPADNDDDWRESISRENAERVASMSQEEREEERRQILEKFGENVGDILKRARLAREKQKQRPKNETVPSTVDSTEKTRTTSIERARSPPPAPTDNDDWRESISRENEERVASMSPEEIEEERRQILERFGENVGDILKRARLAREKQKHRISVPRAVDMTEDTRTQSQEPVPVITEERRSIERARSPPPVARSPPPSALASPGSTRPSSRADRVLRFAELEPEDVHVYDSAPPSPKRKRLALPPPDPSAENQVVSLGKFKGKLDAAKAGQVQVQPEPNAIEVDEPNKEPEEGSAEYIRQKFFPHVQKDDPSVAWMDVDSSVLDTSSTALRFDLHGNPISPADSLKLPTHLGLHHHAEGAHAGYTLDDIFLLSRSTVPAQRASMLSILARIAHRLAQVKKGDTSGMEELVGKEDELRKRILAAGVEAMPSRGNVGMHAIEIVWECIVGWNLDVEDLEGIELDSTTDTAIDSLPMEFFLPQIATTLTQGDAAPESAIQLLSILHRLAQHNLSIATNIVSTPKLISSVLQTFLLTPIFQENSKPLPDPLALQFLCTLGLSSRSNAEEIEKYADSLLRFVTYSSFDSPYPPALANTLLIFSLRLYRILASYGLYAHIAGTAVEQLTHIEQYVVSEACNSTSLTVAWAQLVEAWTTCAIDPHQTTPPHDVKWSQVIGWSWNMGMSELQDRLEAREQDWIMWRASWQAQAAWLEGSKVNAIKGGEAERTEFLETARSGFESGKEAKVVSGVMKAIQEEIQGGDLKKLAEHVGLLAAVVRLWLACVPPHVDDVPPSPPFALPYATISELARRLLVHPVWEELCEKADPYSRVHCRELSQFLSYYLRLSKRLPGTSRGLWLAQVFSILSRLGPGDEDFAQLIIKELSTILTAQWAADHQIKVSKAIWDRGGLRILEPFLLDAIRPKGEEHIGPLTITPLSIKSSTSQRLPSNKSTKKLGLPLHRDWTMMPLAHLLRSADSAVFKELPEDWDSSEVEVTRAALFLTKVVQEALLNFSMMPFVISREEVVFSCMKIFMLEHGQPQNDSSEEVFRDDVVGGLMKEVLRPYASSSQDVVPLSAVPNKDLEKVAARFLGPSVPFFQFYTDFVSLYDAISFSHQTFALLLVPPTSMRYPVDFRKHLWCDFNHVVRTIRVSASEVLSADVGEFLYPIETDPQVIASFLGSLLKDNIHDFMRFVALHHIASNIWPDLQDLDKETPFVKNEERSSTLLKAIVLQGGNELVKDVVHYRQRVSSSLVPPACFEGLDEEIKTSRMDYISRWGRESMVERLQGLFI
ncbi:hypothetical protein D9613_005772 [Agrocybe pediades]|uniref:RNA polymerase II-associated protein 1 n=1 Tax=Agrocybe pediades TaxID=84607 RepID=A0A8H4VRJ8_9AGAR|nr:hypothetical protein D9613_005772 [Agrocybe pediades]